MHAINPYTPQGDKVFNHISGVPGNWTVDVDTDIILRESKNWDYVGKGFSLFRGILAINEGFRFDGASGPAIDGVGNMLAALVHDCLYIAIRDKYKPIKPRVADRIYRKISIAQGAGKIRAWTHWTALRGFGWIWRLFGLGVVSVLAFLAASCVRIQVAGDWVHRGQHVEFPTNATPSTVNIDNLQEGGGQQLTPKISYK
jgi:hypothetical protein